MAVIVGSALSVSLLNFPSTSFAESAKTENVKAEQKKGYEWYYETKFSPTNKEKESWLESLKTGNPSKYPERHLKYKKQKELLSEKIDLNSPEIKKALQIASQLNENTERPLSKEEVQALKIETKIIQQQFLNHLVWFSLSKGMTSEKTFYTDKFRHLYNRLGDIQYILMVNDVKDDEFLESMLDYRKTIEEDFSRRNEEASDDFLMNEFFKQTGKDLIAYWVSENKSKEDVEIYKKILENEAYKKFKLIEESFKKSTKNLERHIELQNAIIINK